MLNQQLTLNCGGQLLNLEPRVVMGILNVTPDSFYDGGRYTDDAKILQQVEKMLTEGAAIIDVGGMSSRPGAKIITTKEELDRTLPIVKRIKKEFPQAIISIDTIKSEVVKACVDAGAGMVNDISAGHIDPLMYETVAKVNVPYVLMHLQGIPETMQLNPTYDNIVQDILDYFIKELGKLRALGIKDIILDPGFGFGKSVDDNYEILRHLHAFQITDLPILVGLSRKSMIYKVLETSAQEALNGTTALHIIALQQGAKILRVHDVKEAVETIKLWRKTTYDRAISATTDGAT